MSIDPDLRIALGLMLLLRICIGIFYARTSPEIGILAELRLTNADRAWPVRCLWALFTMPLIAFLLDAQGLARALYEINSVAAEYSIMWLPDLLRCCLLVPAVAGLLLLIWTYHSAISPAEMNANDLGRNRFIVGPFRAIRFPQWTADFLFFGSLLVATDNWIAVGSYLAAGLVFRSQYLPQSESAWQRLLGTEYGDYVRCSGALLPRLPADVAGLPAQYSVPKRFGLSAIIGLVTMFAVMFGAINLLQSQIMEFDISPTVHLFFGLQLMTIWIGQMRFGQAPRRISALVGAVLLPTFVYFGTEASVVSNWTPILVVLFFLGALIGYCLGAVAAGLFLMIDWIGSYLPATRNSSFAANSDSTNGHLPS